MAKSLSLSDAALRALESARRANESLSDVVLRLHAAASAPRKEPMRFLDDAKRLRAVASPQARMASLERSREAGQRRAREMVRRWRS